ncbi:MAG TPA: His/Gly/Thr/Pro-type tRNA ligase C-terminal domain-containing protein, partial [bacterium]|nr:His/Gly/Thr/Pro-type tRNA ligase C-terminal domain-containing protein [bacterium]
ITILKDLKLSKVPTEKPQVFVIQLGSSAKKKAFSILRQLLAAGIKTASSLSSNSLKTQLKMATKNNVRFALIIGQRELLDKTVIIKDLQNGSQETVDLKQYLAILLERLK